MRAVAAVALALALASAACDSGTADPLASPSPSPTEPTSPSPAASADVKVALEQVVRDYYAEANRALATGNVARLRTLSTDRCACRKLVSYIERRYREGSLRNAQFIVRGVRPYLTEPARAVVQVVQESPASQVLDKAGRIVREIPAELNTKEDVYLIRQEDKWIVDNIVGLS